MLAFVKTNVTNWVEGDLCYDEHVPGWVLAPVLACAGAGSIAWVFSASTIADAKLPSAALLPLVLASAGVAVAMMGRWVWMRNARTVPLCTAASLWAAVTWLGFVPALTTAVWPPFAMLFLSPLLVPAIGRGFAMLAWHHRLETTMRENRSVMQNLLDGNPREGVYLLRADAVQGDDVQVVLLDGTQTIEARAPRGLWSSVGPGRWYLARGLTTTGGKPGQSASNASPSSPSLRITTAARLDFLGVSDPREERRRETFVPEIAFWLTSLAGLVVASAAGAWTLAHFAS